jgi:hypothetical protein
VIKNSKHKRPLLITFLGIIGFIEVALSMELGLFRIFTGISLIPANDIKNLSGIEKVKDLKVFTNDLFTGIDTQLVYTNKVIDNSIFLGVISFLASVFCFIGIVWMWKLKKKGYYVYIVGEMLPIIATIALVGLSFTGTMAIISVLLPLVFIILWGINLKHMN